MSIRNNLLLLEDIGEACDKIIRYIDTLSYHDFSDDDKTIDAVIRNFEIIGEAANSLSDRIYHQFSFINWRQIIGLRHRLIHNYFGVDLSILWQIIQENIPVLKRQIEEIILVLKAEQK